MMSTRCRGISLRTEIHLFRRTWSTFRFCGYVGLVFAIIVSSSLVVRLSLSPGLFVGLTIASVLTFFGVALATKILLGQEQLVYYHHEIAILCTVALVTWLLRRPLLAYLDVVILGVGAFLFCGRIGCLMVGCCHGRPGRWGVCYREEHVATGFPQHYVGVRLFPVQALESLWVLGVVVVGVVLLLAGQPAGSALAWYVIAYDIGRFSFEFLRGDADRPYYAGFSEAQWTALLLMVAVAVAETAGLMPRQLWHSAATAGLVVVILAAALRRRWAGIASYQLGHPHHVREVAVALRRLDSPATDYLRLSPAAKAHIETTSLGVQISAGRIGQATHQTAHYALSWPDRDMTHALAETLAVLILQLKRHTGSYSLVSGKYGVFHLIAGNDHRADAQPKIIGNVEYREET